MADAQGALRYSEGVMERLRAAHAGKSAEELLELVCQLTKTYVLDQTIPYDLPLPERAAQERVDRPDVPNPSESEDEDAGEPTWERFARLIEGLKRRTGLPQLQGFERGRDGRTVLIVDNQRVTFGERVTVEFVPRSSPRPSAVGQVLDDSDDVREAIPGAPPSAASPVPGAPAPAAAPSPGAPPPRPAPAVEEPPAQQPAQDDLDDVDHVVERFRGLELE